MLDVGASEEWSERSAPDDALRICVRGGELNRCSGDLEEAKETAVFVLTTASPPRSSSSAWPSRVLVTTAKSTESASSTVAAAAAAGLSAATATNARSALRRAAGASTRVCIGTGGLRLARTGAGGGNGSDARGERRDDADAAAASRLDATVAVRRLGVVDRFPYIIGSLERGGSK